jgi:phytoene dehydrogenase-like protein
VTLFEQGARAGGVTQGLAQDGFQWDYGQLNFEGLGKDDALGEVLVKLGILDMVKVLPAHRDYLFPDFELRPPETYAGPKWRIEELKRLFPDEERGLERYWKDYIRFTRLVTLGRRLETGGIAGKAAFYAALLPLLPKVKWTAERLLGHYFRSEKLKAVFVSILADFFTPPSQFQGLGVFALNSEKAYDERVPAHLAKNAECVGLYSIAGGTQALVEAYLERLRLANVRVRVNCAVKRIVVEDNHVTGVEDQNGVIHACERVVASGAAKEGLLELLEPGILAEDYVEKVKGIPLMDSVFMLHLGVDKSWPEVLRCSSTYFYGSYDIEGQVKQARAGVYHEGAAGFVVHLPTPKTPYDLPEGKQAMTIYTICPDRLAEGDWERDKLRYADKLLEYAEVYLPGLREHVVTRVVVTPIDFRRMTGVGHHAFGGIAPLMGAWKVGHKTPVEGLWFIGAQSESGGGMNAVIPAADKIARIENRE